MWHIYILFFIFDILYYTEYDIFQTLYQLLFNSAILYIVLLDQSKADSTLSLSDHFERKSKTNDLFQYVFASVAGKKGHVTMADVLSWDFTQVNKMDLTLFDLI